MKIVVFAGGVGTRLWPLSRKSTPKQFGKIIGNESTLQQTIRRLTAEFKPEDIFIATGKQYKSVVMKQLPEIPEGNFIFESMMRDVGPAIGLSSFILEKKFPNEPIAILWSDHMVKNEDAFRHVLRLAEKKIVSKESEFVFIGQKPRFPNQNCGWIQLGDENESSNGASVYNFKRLCYRPKAEEAEAFFKDRNYVWNLGYFVTTPKYLTSLFKTYAPEMFESLLKIQNDYGKDKYEKTLEGIYPTLEKISFDDAILVKLPQDNLKVIATDLGWSDVGAWDALKEALETNKEENITRGNIELKDTTDVLMFNYEQKLCIGIDLSEMVIINTEDVLLVCPKGSIPKIKKFVENLTGTDHEHLI
ncbi:MAG TPA: sugar phosphate nucleotidyltransferase [Xanthomonadales bacterium]|nr:sugar phosphate nucleotidyltransferase [Xanthomonadales bacterium]